MFRRLRVAISEKKSRLPENTVRLIGFFFLAGFFLLFVILGINLSKSGLLLKRSLSESASKGFDQIAKGAAFISTRDFSRAKSMFGVAEQTFSSIRNSAWFASDRVAAGAVKDPVLRAGNALIESGKYLSSAGILFSESGQNLALVPQKFFEANRATYNPETNASLTKPLKGELPRLKSAINALASAQNAIDEIPQTFVPSATREKFMFAKNALSTLSSFLSTTSNNMPAILTMLGDDKSHTFLVLLQNNDELRPSGGFLGNFMIIETREGYITKTEVTDIYRADHQLKEVINPPPEIETISQRWYMRDSNYSIDFPTSAKKTLEFLQKETGISADTVFAIDTSFIRDLLDLTGPVYVSSLQKPLSSSNFNQIISYIVESKINGKEDPKAILREFMPNIEKAIFRNTDPVSIIPFFNAVSEEKHFQGFSFDPQIENFFQDIGIDGKLAKTGERDDYLAIAHTSIGGNKSDAYIDEIVQHDTYINSDGTLEDEVSITRTHTWNSRVESGLKTMFSSFGYKNFSDELLRILGKGTSIHMLRVYVPKGSVLLACTSCDAKTAYDPDVDKSYFSLPMGVEANNSSTLKIKYRLPFKLNLSPAGKYFLLAQKQPGQDRAIFIKRLLPESGVMNFTYFPGDGSFDPDGVWRIETPFNKDLSFSSAWGK